MMEEKKRITSEILFAAIEEELKANRKASFTVTGMSMWPFLCHGRDQVMIEAVDPQRIQKGDIVLFKVPGDKYILHRVTDISSDWFETTGDGNLCRDGRFPYDCLVARVFSVVRKGRTISRDSRSWRWLSSVWMALYPVRKPISRTWLWLRKYIR